MSNDKDRHGAKKPQKRREGAESRTRFRPWRSVAGFWFDLSRAGLPKLLGTFILAIVIFGAIAWQLEAPGGAMFTSFFDGIWWAVVTIATVGYGDTYPVSTFGRVVGMALILAGVVLTSLISGAVASMFVERRIREGKGLMDVRLKNHIVLCGWSQNAGDVLAEFEKFEGRSRVVLVNANESEWFDGVKSDFPGLDLRFVRGDFTQEATLRKAAVQAARACIVVPDASGAFTQANSDERTILGCLTVKAINPDIVVNAEILKRENEQHLRRANVDGILVNGQFSGFLLASSSLSKGVSEAAACLLSSDSASRISQVPFPQQLSGKTFAEASEWFLKNGKGLVIGVLAHEKKVSLDDLLSDDSSAIDAFIKRKFLEAEIDLGEEGGAGSSVKLNPGALYLIQEGDTAFVIGSAR